MVDQMTPRDYQMDMGLEASEILDRYNLVYLAAEERTGKTISAMVAVENFSPGAQVLVLTTKPALEGWKNTIEGCKEWSTAEYTLINYHSAHKVLKYTFDIVILDEAHSYVSAFPKRSKLWENCKLQCYNKPLIYISATPCAEGRHKLFNQFALSTYSPWKEYRDGYKWYYEYAERTKSGAFKTIKVKDRDIRIYDAVQHERIWDECEHLFITKTRKELGFRYEPQNKIHYIELSDNVKNAYNILVKYRVLKFETGGKEYKIIADSMLKLRTVLHQLEGGTLKLGENNFLTLGSTLDKINYIKETWGDTEDLVIMYHYTGEGNKLRELFQHAKILQATTYAEGIDLYQHEHLVIYSQDFRTSKYIQRRARQANLKRETEIIVHFLLVKNAVSDQVYQSVVEKKKNFTDSIFEEKTI